MHWVFGKDNNKSWVKSNTDGTERNPERLAGNFVLKSDAAPHRSQAAVHRSRATPHRSSASSVTSPHRSRAIPHRSQAMPRRSQAVHHRSRAVPHPSQSKGIDISFTAASASACCLKCSKHKECSHWTYGTEGSTKGACAIKTAKGPPPQVDHKAGAYDPCQDQDNFAGIDYQVVSPVSPVSLVSLVSRVP